MFILLLYFIYISMEKNSVDFVTAFSYYAVIAVIFLITLLLFFCFSSDRRINDTR